MLTIQDLKADAQLAALDEAILSKIATLSKNDEQVVIDEKTSEIHSRYDSDIETITGEKKPAGEKTYVFLKSQLAKLKTDAAKAGSATKLETELANLKTEKADLEKKLQDGAGDTVLKKKVEELERTVRLKNDEVENLKSTNATEIQRLTKEVADERTNAFQRTAEAEFAQWEADKKFIGTIPEAVLRETKENRRKAILANLKTDTLDGKTVILDENDKVLRNKDNNNNPFTLGEFYGTKIADLLDTGKKVEGTGTKGGGNTGGGTSLDSSTWKSQIEADAKIVDHLMKNEGLDKLNPQFAERQQQLRTESGVDKLPMRE